MKYSHDLQVKFKPSTQMEPRIIEYEEDISQEELIHLPCVEGVTIPSNSTGLELP